MIEEIKSTKTKEENSHVKIDGGVAGVLNELLEEQKKTNALLQSLVEGLTAPKEG